MDSKAAKYYGNVAVYNEKVGTHYAEGFEKAKGKKITLPSASIDLLCRVFDYAKPFTFAQFNGRDTLFQNATS